MATSSKNPSDTSIRITRAGKINNYVAYALESLEKNDSNPIVLHTLPKPPDNQTATDVQPTKNDQDASNTAITLLTTPKLISVVEIIKREYLKDLEKKRSTRLVGLHQYNEIGSREDPQGNVAYRARETDEERAQRIAIVLEGKNFPKQQQSPYMRITLSTHELPELLKKGATYQKPLTRTLSKTAKKRAKLNQKKAAQQDEATENAGLETS
ncbi:hypothetical protein FB446DRAFT_121927 [Lentinula raphanica]|nr:hypothetical protein FB446DRAFT_121927 [Lentinula raphanica]